MRLPFLEKDIRRDFKNRIRNKEDCQAQIVLSPSQMEVGCKLTSVARLQKTPYSLKLRIPDIRSIEEGEEIQ